MDKKSDIYTEQLILKSYGLIDSNSLDQINPRYKRGKKKSSPPPKLKGISRRHQFNAMKSVPYRRKSYQDKVVENINHLRQPPIRQKSRRADWGAVLNQKTKSSTLWSRRVGQSYAGKLSELGDKIRVRVKQLKHDKYNLEIRKTNNWNFPVPKPYSNPSHSNSKFVAPTVELDSRPELPKRSYNMKDRNEKCILCGLPLYDTLATEEMEKIVELKCPHKVHEQCLILEIELKMMDPGSKELYPVCPKCEDHPLAIPIDKDITSQLKVHTLLDPYTKHELMASLLPSSVSQPLQLSSPKLPRRSPLRNQKLMRYKLCPDGSKYLLHNEISWTSKYTIASLKAKLLKDLFTLSKDLSLQLYKHDIALSEQIIHSLGSIRILDKLMVRIDGAQASECYCYLFLHYILILSTNSRVFIIASIKPFSHIELISKETVLIPEDLNVHGEIIMQFPTEQISTTWINALQHSGVEFPLESITSSTAENEFGTFFQKKEAIKYQIQKDSSCYRGKVNTAFYKEVFPEPIFLKRPKSMIIVINQHRIIPSTTIHILNVLRCINLLKINIAFIMCSALNLSMGSLVTKHLILHESDFKNSAKTLKAEITSFQNSISLSNDSQYSLHDCVEECSNKLGREKLSLAVISTSTLNDFKDIALDNLLLEVSVGDEHCYTMHQCVVGVVDWENVMEVLCQRFQLDFDNVPPLKILGSLSTTSSILSETTVSKKKDHSKLEKSLNLDALMDDLDLEISKSHP